MNELELELEADAILAKHGWPDGVLTSRQLRYIAEEREYLCPLPDPGRAGVFGRAHVKRNTRKDA